LNCRHMELIGKKLELCFPKAKSPYQPTNENDRIRWRPACIFSCVILISILLYRKLVLLKLWGRIILSCSFSLGSYGLIPLW
jgi:hypothetical protein